MILKELDPSNTGDPLLRAGIAAEEQMAHYLRRAFGADSELLIFNSVRLEEERDAAQIDHLVLHRWGVIVVESKSVTTRVVINAHVEWVRYVKGRPSGMASPVLQAKRQGEFLRAYLARYQESLLGKFMLGKLQKTFTHMSIDVVVAISDSGIIERSKGWDLAEVSKADQVPDRIRAILQRLRRENSLFNLNPNTGGWDLTTEERARIGTFLLEHHRPLFTRPSSAPESGAAPMPHPSPPMEVEAPAPACAPAVEAHPARTHSCRICHGGSLSVQWGKFGYYFKCADCDGNTPIREECPNCAGRKKIRKNGLQFFAECGTCETSQLFYQNRLGA